MTDDLPYTSLTQPYALPYGLNLHFDQCLQASLRSDDLFIPPRPVTGFLPVPVCLKPQFHESAELLPAPPTQRLYHPCLPPKNCPLVWPYEDVGSGYAQ